MTLTDDIKMVVTHDRQERQPITAVWQKWRFSASYDSFVGQQTVVLRINICGENRHLRQAVSPNHRRFRLLHVVWRCGSFQSVSILPLWSDNEAVCAPVWDKASKGHRTDV